MVWLLVIQRYGYGCSYSVITDNRMVCLELDPSEDYYKNESIQWRYLLKPTCTFDGND